MNIETCVNSLSMPLPEDILKRKWAGDLDGAIRAIDLRLERELPEMLRARLVCERERIRRLPTQYPWNREQALAKFQEIVPGMTSEIMDELEMGGWTASVPGKGCFVHGIPVGHHSQRERLLLSFDEMTAALLSSGMTRGELAEHILKGGNEDA